MRARRIVTRNFIVYWRAWRASFVLSVLGPVMFLSAMGFGLGSMVQEGRSFGGAEYLPFFATGILAASAFQSGAFTGSYPIMAKITWQRNYEAILSSPLGIKDIVFGELLWTGVMLTQTTFFFFLVMALFGVFTSPLAIAAIPVAVLMGVSATSVVLAFTATLKTDEAYTWMFRFIVTPLFLLSGTFFPIEELPAWGRAVAFVTPLYHGVELVRQLTLYELESTAIVHLAYLLGVLGLGTAWALRTFERRLRA